MLSRNRRGHRAIKAVCFLHCFLRAPYRLFSFSMERVRNLASFKDIAEKVATLEAIKAIPGSTFANYADLLESVALLLKRWSGLAAVVTANPDATRLVMVVRRIYHSLSSNKSFVLSSVAREFLAFHSQMVKINPSLAVGTPPTPSPSPPTGPVRLISFSIVSNFLLTTLSASHPRQR